MQKLLIVQLIITAIVLSGCQTVGTIDRGDMGQGNWHRSLNDTSYGYVSVTDKKTNAVIEKFEVRDGDCNSNDNWDDCKQGSQRSELSGPKNIKIGSKHWLNYDIYFPEDYPLIYPATSFHGQFKTTIKKGAPSSSAPPIFFNVNLSGYNIRHNIIQGTTANLIPESELRGKWYNIKVHTKWSYENDGFLKVYVDNNLKYSYSGPTVALKNKLTLINFKYGIYQIGVSNYKCSTGDCDSKMPPQIVLYKNVKLTKSRYNNN